MQAEKVHTYRTARFCIYLRSLVRPVQSSEFEFVQRCHATVFEWHEGRQLDPENGKIAKTAEWFLIEDSYHSADPAAPLWPFTEETGLFLNFADLLPDKNTLRLFSGRHGHLGNPVRAVPPDYCLDRTKKLKLPREAFQGVPRRWIAQHKQLAAAVSAWRRGDKAVVVAALTQHLVSRLSEFFPSMSLARLHSACSQNA